MNPRQKPKRKWTHQEINLIETLYKNGVKQSQIAARVGVTVDQVKAVLKKLEVPRTHRAPTLDPSLPRQEQFAELLARGFEVKRIGEIMGYKDYSSANAQFQRIRRHMGEQAR
jgi:hypothetical protein